MDDLEFENLDSQIAEIESEINKLEKLINANDEKYGIIEKIKQEENEVKRKSLHIEGVKITHDSLGLQSKQLELSAEKTMLIGKKFKLLKERYEQAINNFDRKK